MFEIPGMKIRAWRIACMSITLAAAVVWLTDDPAYSQAIANPIPIEGSAVLARMRGNALIIWDCTKRLQELQKTKTANTDILEHLETDALSVLYLKSSDLSPALAKTTSVRVVYMKTGDVNPAYGADTFGGVERLITVTAPTANIHSQAASWIRQASSGQPLLGATAKVEGELPPQ
jgi:hypothetical protein